MSVDYGKKTRVCKTLRVMRKIARDGTVQIRKPYSHNAIFFSHYLSGDTKLRYIFVLFYVI